MKDGTFTADRLLALYDRVSEAEDAIPRLRRFVLDLAVRGKLVEQDPTDEPAAELLKRLGKGRVGAQDMPTSWLSAKLGEVIDLQYGKGLDKKLRLDEGSVPVFGSNGIVCFTEEPLTTRPSIIVGRKGSAGALNLCDGPSWTTDVAYFVEVPSFLTLRYLFNLLSSLGLDGLGKGVKPGLSRSDAYDLSVSLPPLAEQQRIVAKVDELMALCDRLQAARAGREAVRDRLTAATLTRLTAPETDAETFPTHARFALQTLPTLTTRPDQIKTLRQTILNLAAQGKLVKQDPTDEPAAELLKRLKSAQKSLSQIEGLRSRPAVEKLDRSDLWFDIPQEWMLSHFDDLFVIVSGVTKGQKVDAAAAVDLPYLRVANVQRGYLDLSVIKTISASKADKERYALRSGDILMTEGGDWDKLGRAAIWQVQIPECIHQNHIFRVRPPSPEILPEWVTTYVNCLLGRRFFEDASKQTTNLASINMTQLRACPIPSHHSPNSTASWQRSMS